MLFNIYGHENILGTHRNTIEFTKDVHLTKDGDCIVGVRADFDPEELRKLVGTYPKLNVSIQIDGIKEDIYAVANKSFKNAREIVIRKTDFLSERTLGINADKAAIDLNRNLINALKHPDNIAKVEIKGINEKSAKQ